MFFEPLRTDGFNENEWMRIDTDSDILTSMVLYNRVIIYSSAAPIPVRAEWSRHGKTVGANCMSAVLQYTKSLSKKGRWDFVFRPMYLCGEIEHAVCQKAQIFYMFKSVSGLSSRQYITILHTFFCSISN